MPLGHELQSQFSAQQVAGLLGSTAQTFTAAGATQATATAIAAQFTAISTATALQGAILPAGATPGDEFDVVNITAVNVCVYPQVGGKINGNLANVPLIMAPGKMHFFQSIDGTNWAVDSY